VQLLLLKDSTAAAPQGSDLQKRQEGTSGEAEFVLRDALEEEAGVSQPRRLPLACGASPPPSAKDAPCSSLTCGASPPPSAKENPGSMASEPGAAAPGQVADRVGRPRQVGHHGGRLVGEAVEEAPRDGLRAADEGAAAAASARAAPGAGPPPPLPPAPLAGASPPPGTPPCRRP